MTKIFTISIVLFLFLSCTKNTELKIYYLKEHRKERKIEKTYYDSYWKKNVYSGVELSETVLIHNYPQNFDSLKIIMLNYFDTIHRKEYENIKFSERSMLFFPYNNETDNFLYNTKDPNQLVNIYIYDVSEVIGSIVYRKCQNDSLKWIKLIKINTTINTTIDTLIYDCGK